MAHDFAKINKARKVENRRTEPAPQPPRGMLITGLLTGLVLGAFFSFLAYISGIVPPVGSVAEVPTDSPEQIAAAQQRRTEELEQAAAQLQLEFYKELPNYEVVVDAADNGRPPAPASTQTVRPAQPTQLATNVTAPATTPPPVATTPATAPPAAAVTAAPSPVSSGPSYMLQAGAFQQEASAIAQSERLAALGLQAQIKKQALLGKTLFLVQSGPYFSRDELAQTERLLRSNSIDTMRIGLSQ